MFKIKFTHFQCTALRILTNAHIQVTYPPVEMINDDAKSLQSCPTLCDFMDCSPPGFSVHGILQAILLEWVAISFSRGSSYPRDGTCISYLLHWQAGSLPLAPPGKPLLRCTDHFRHPQIVTCPLAAIPQPSDKQCFLSLETSLAFSRISYKCNQKC